MGERDSLPQAELSTGLLLQLLRYTRSLGLDNDDLLRSQGVDPAIAATPDVRIPAEQYLAVQDEAVRRSGDDLFGLHMGAFAEAGSYSILGYLMMNCASLGQAFLKSARYWRIIGTMIDGSYRLGPGTIKVIYRSSIPLSAMSRHCFESTFASLARMMRSLTGLPLNPLAVTFTWPGPADIRPYTEYFGCPVDFGARQNSITLETRIGRLPILAPNPQLRDHFEAYARGFLAGLDDPRQTSRTVVMHILEHLDEESLSVRQIARAMSVSVRTLQGRLKAEGLVFSDLLINTRRRLAMQYLRANQSVEEITYLLGYSSPSAFHKAFKKWSGLTPGEYRVAALAKTD